VICGNYDAPQSLAEFARTEIYWCRGPSLALAREKKRGDWSAYAGGVIRR
jgi:hypothetical protein